MSNVLLSLCIPTNGISEWVFPVLDSIYGQGVDNNLFEVIVTDNGDDTVFYNKMKQYTKQHDNMIYKRTTAYMFENQLEAVKLASGCYVKFINHRLILLNDSLEHFLKFINNNIEKKPVAYFSNGELHAKTREYKNFDDFVAGLGKFASWTTGVGIWREQFLNIPADTKVDKISPHSYILFADRKNEKYIIDDTIFGREIDVDQSRKGTYDLFKAFGVEEFLITLNLYVDGDISARTVKKVKKKYKKFLYELYWNYVVRKKPCSYKIDGFKDAMGIIFSKNEIIVGAYLLGLKSFVLKIKGVFVK